MDKLLAVGALLVAFTASAQVAYESETTNAYFTVDVSGLSAVPSSSPWALPVDGDVALIGENDAKRIDLDTDFEQPLIYTAESNGKVVLITANMTAAVNASEPELSAAALQAALAVVAKGAQTNWLGRVGGDSEHPWKTFTSVTPIAGREYEVNIEIDNHNSAAPRIRYRVDGAVLTDGTGDGWYANPKADATTVASVSFSGCGQIGDFGGADIIENEATFNGTGYTTFDEALTAAKKAWGASNHEPIVLYKDVSYAATATEKLYVNANQHTFTITGDTVIHSSSGNEYTITAKTDCEASIGGTYYVTFDEAYAAASDQSVIVINKGLTKSLTITKSLGINPNGKLNCAMLIVNDGVTFNLAGDLAVTTATLNGTGKVVGDGTLTVSGTLTGTDFAKVALANNATFAYGGTTLLPSSVGTPLTVSGLADVAVGTEIIGQNVAAGTVVTPTGLPVAKCLEISVGKLVVVSNVTIETPTEGEGYDYENGTISMTASVKSGDATAELTVVDYADGQTIKCSGSQSVVSGTPLTWSLPATGSLVPGGVYTYRIDIKIGGTIVETRFGEFTAAKWGADGSWFYARATSGTDSVYHGTWAGGAPGIVENRYEVSDSVFNVTDQAGTNKYTRVDTKVTFDALIAEPDVPEDAAVGGFVAVAGENGGPNVWKALTLVENELTWVTLADAAAPVVGVEYTIRSELDFPNDRVRFLVDAGEGFVPLTYADCQWLSTASDKRTLDAVEFQGAGKLAFVEATISDKAVARVNGQGYATVAEAIAAAGNGGTVELLTNATYAPTGAIAVGTFTITGGKDLRVDLSGAQGKWKYVYENGTLTVKKAGAGTMYKFY